jgi:aspartate/methionine/tyrosine aminotransferase
LEGAEGHIRMSFATSEEVIYEAMDRIKTVLI